LNIPCNGKNSVLPLITMEWVQGTPLLAWAEEKSAANDRNAFRDVAAQWMELISDLQSNGISHCDLQDQNVMVTDTGRLRLVDYDDMCVPAIEGWTTQGAGVEPYQHPQRGDLLALNIDHFSALFIYVALRALAEDPSLWRTYVTDRNYDKMIFTAEDFDNPQGGSIAAVRKLSPEVGKLVDALVKFRELPIDQCKPLSDVRFSYDDVRKKLHAGDWDAALRLLDDNPTGRAKAPADMTALIDEGDKRIKCRTELAALVKSGDEAGMSACYSRSRALLDDYQAAQADVAIAKQAASAIPLLAELKQYAAASQWVELVRCWKSAGILQKRSSAAPYLKLVLEWEPRNDALEKLIEALKRQPLDLLQIKAAANTLKSLGGHPQGAQYESQVNTLVACADVWPKVEACLQAAGQRPFSYRRDCDLIAAWDAGSRDLSGWAVAMKEKPVVDKARQRAATVDQFRGQADSAAASKNRQQLGQAAAGALQIEAGYDHPEKKRSAEVASQHKALETLDTCLNSTPSDTAITTAWGDVKKHRADPYVDQMLGERLTAFTEVSRLPRNVAVDEFHTLLRKTWKPCLNAWPPAAKWKKRYDDEVLRAKLLKDLAAAIKATDDSLSLDLAEHELLQDYPLPQEWRDYLETGKVRTSVADNLLEAVSARDPDLFRLAFDVEVVTNHSSRFAHVQKDLLDLARTELGQPEQLGMYMPMGRSAVTSLGAMARVRVGLPEKRLVRKCIIGICSDRPFKGLKPNDAAVLRKQPLTHEIYEGGGGVVIASPGIGNHIIVWGVIELGFTEIYSEFMYLGQT